VAGGAVRDDVGAAVAHELAARERAARDPRDLAERPLPRPGRLICRLSEKPALDRRRSGRVTVDQRVQARRRRRGQRQLVLRVGHIPGAQLQEQLLVVIVAKLGQPKPKCRARWLILAGREQRATEGQVCLGSRAWVCAQLDGVADAVGGTGDTGLQARSA
jgi:hypothetical protein